MTTSAGNLTAVFFTRGIEPGAVRVRSLDIDEAVSVETRCKLRLACDHAVFDSRGLLGQMASLVVVKEDGSVTRRFHGVVRRVTEKAATTPDRLEFSLELASPLSILDDRSDSRIYQEMTTREIVDKVLHDAGLAPELVEWRVGAQTKWTTCTQYHEASRQFVDRVLAHEGVCWFVEHREDGPVVIFADASSGYADSGPSFAYRQMLGANADEFIASVASICEARPEKIVLRDYDFTKPTLKVEAEHKAVAALGREHYEYPAHATDPAQLKARAALTSDVYLCATEARHLTGSMLRSTAGHVLEVEGTPDGDGRHVATRTAHRWVSNDGGAGLLGSEVWTIPATQRFVPPLRPWPSAVGDLAKVTVPSGEDVHADQHGRVKVLYHWDRHGEQDDTSSGWTRVAQLHTSGAVAIPRSAWEVLVEFENGDPERPVVAGRLYNAATPPVDSLPGNKTNSVLMSYGSPKRQGHNEIRMNDGGGGELVQVHAEKDLNLVVANDKQEKVATTASIGVKVDQTVTVGGDQTETVGAGETVTIGADQTHKVGGSRTKNVAADEKFDMGSSRSLTIGADHTTMTPMSDSTSTKASLTETVSGLALEAAALGVGLAVAGSTSISVGAAKIEAVATGKSDLTVGARASTVGGAFVNVTPKDITFNTSGVKVTTVGGAWLGAAAGDAEFSSQATLSITVGGAVLMNAASITLKVGGSKVTIAAAQVVMEASEIAITASGPAMELSAGVQSK